MKPDKRDSVSILDDWVDSKETFKDFVISKFKDFKDLTCREIEEKLIDKGMDLHLNDGSKQYHYQLSMAMFGITGKKHIKEFDEADITLKAIRTY